MTVYGVLGRLDHLLGRYDEADAWFADAWFAEADALNRRLKQIESPRSPAACLGFLQSDNWE